jgi:hypothetical protein
MNDLASLGFRVQVRDFERGDRLQGQRQGFISVFSLAPIPQVSSHLSQDTEDLRPIKPLTATVLTEVRHWIYTSD